MQSNRITAVDYLKGFSIFTIALMHLMNLMSAIPGKVQTLTKIGGTGVHVFFLCSGIGLYLSYMKKKTTYSEFIKRRFLKIYIPYIIVVLVSFFLPWMYKGGDRIIALLSHVFLFKMFIPAYEESFGVQFWFVSTIIQFYLVFIPMCKIKEKLKSNKLFFGFFFILSICWWGFSYIAGLSDIRIWNSFFLQYIWEFALGFIIAEKLREGKVFRFNNVLLFVVAIVGMGLQGCMAFAAEVLKVFNDIPALFGYTALLLIFMNIPVIKKVAIWLSNISYEYYLVHNLLFISIFHLLKPQGLMRQCALGFGSMLVAMLIASIYHKIIYSVVFKKAKVQKNTAEQLTTEQAEN